MPFRVNFGKKSLQETRLSSGKDFGSSQPERPYGSAAQGSPSELGFTLVLVDNTSVGTHAFAYSKSAFSDAAKNVRFNIAKVGVHYNLSLDEFSKALTPGSDQTIIRVEDVVGFDSLGLFCGVGHDGLPHIEGTPSNEYDGMVRIHVCCERNGVREKDDFDVSREFKIVSEIIDPWKLWQDIPAPDNAPYQTPDTASVSGFINVKSPIVVLGASRRGRSHAHRGDFRDDAVAVRIADYQTSESKMGEYEWHVLTVSDGAGSAVYSREGARLVCEKLTNTIFDEMNFAESRKKRDEAIKNIFGSSYQKALRQHELDPAVEASGILEARSVQGLPVVDTAQRAVYSVVKAIHEEAQERNSREGRTVSMRDYSATALCVAMKRFKGEIGWKNNPTLRPPFWAILSYWVGDGVMAIYRPNKQAKVWLLGAPDEGEFAGETRFITSTDEASHDRVAPRVQLTFVKNFEGIVLATDGVSDPFFTSDKALKDFGEWSLFWEANFKNHAHGAFDPKQTPADRADELVEWLNFREKGYHDDRSIVVALNDKITSED